MIDPHAMPDAEQIKAWKAAKKAERQVAKKAAKTGRVTATIDKSDDTTPSAAAHAGADADAGTCSGHLQEDRTHSDSLEPKSGTKIGAADVGQNSSSSSMGADCGVASNSCHLDELFGFDATSQIDRGDRIRRPLRRQISRSEPGFLMPSAFQQANQAGAQVRCSFICRNFFSVLAWVYTFQREVQVLMSYPLQPVGEVHVVLISTICAFYASHDGPHTCWMHTAPVSLNKCLIVLARGCRMLSQHWSALRSTAHNAGRHC